MDRYTFGSTMIVQLGYQVYLWYGSILLLINAVLKKIINAKKLNYAEAILYFCGNNTNITYLDVDKKVIS